MSGIDIKLIAGAVILIIVIVALAMLVGSGSSYAANGKPFVIAITDPPAVPSGTQSLIITYSQIELHQKGAANGTGFVALNTSGTINLLSLTNLTKTIAVANINSNDTFDMARFTVTSAQITIDNSTYNVSIPNNKVTILLNQNASVSNSSGILIDFYPSVLQIYAANQSIFVMIPSAKAVVITDSSNISVSTNVGGQVAVSTAARNEIERARAQANITITGARMSQTGNTTSVTVTVRNNGNQSVMLRHVFVSGYMKAMMNLSAVNSDVRDMGNIAADVSGGIGTHAAPIFYSHDTKEVSAGFKTKSNLNAGTNGSGTSGSVNSSTSANASSDSSYINASAIGNEIVHELNGTFDMGGNITENLTIALKNTASLDGKVKEILGTNSLNYSTEIGDLESVLHSRLNATIAAGFRTANINTSDFRDTVRYASSFEHRFHNNMNFIVMANGTLQLPMSETEFEGNAGGYTLAPGSTVTLTYSGTANIGSSPAMIALISNQTYSVRVFGTQDTHVSTNVTAN
jgi:hypothetical protein